MRFFDKWLDRGSSVNVDFIPYDDKGWILKLDGIGCTDDFSNIKTAQGQVNAYCLVSNVGTIINRKAESFANGKVWILDKPGSEPTTQEANNARSLLLNPNPLQTWEEFYLQQKVYKSVFGYCPIYAIRPVGFSSIKALYNILPLIFNVEYTGKWHQTEQDGIIESYYLSYNNTRIPLKIEDVHISRDVSPSLKQGCFLPSSRLASLQYTIANAMAIPEAKYTMVKRRGALGILSNETKDTTGSIPITKGEKEQIQREYRQYGLSPRLNQIIITESNLKWQQIGISTKELMLIELGDDAKIAIADAYGYPYELLGSQKGVTFSNKKEAKKQFYQDIIIPEAKADSQALTKFLGLTNCYIDIDFSSVSILQEDKKEKADTLSTTVNALTSALASNIITTEEARSELSKLMDIDP